MFAKRKRVFLERLISKLITPPDLHFRLCFEMELLKACTNYFLPLSPYSLLRLTQNFLVLLRLKANTSFRSLRYRNVNYNGKKKISLTLWILTTHICVENTVLASMICFLFKLSYNVMIMCEWHQLMYIAIIAPSKPTTPPDFCCISPFILATKPKMPIFRPNNNIKNYPYLSSNFNPNNLFNNLKSTFTANLKVRPWYLTGSFPLNAFRGLYFNHFIITCLVLPRSRPKRVIGNSAIARA